MPSLSSNIVCSIRLSTWEEQVHKDWRNCSYRNFNGGQASQKCHSFKTDKYKTILVNILCIYFSRNKLFCTKPYSILSIISEVGIASVSGQRRRCERTQAASENSVESKENDEDAGGQERKISHFPFAQRQRQWAISGITESKITQLLLLYIFQWSIPSSQIELQSLWVHPCPEADPREPLSSQCHDSPALRVDVVAPNFASINFIFS